MKSILKILDEAISTSKTRITVGDLYDMFSGEEITGKKFYISVGGVMRNIENVEPIDTTKGKYKVNLRNMGELIIYNSSQINMEITKEV